MKDPNKLQVKLLTHSVNNMSAKDIEQYFTLQSQFKELKLNPALKRDAFQEQYANYYKLKQAHLGDITEKYFTRLFEYNGNRGAEDYRILLNELWEIKRLKGDNSLQFSFVSKLIAFHHEDNPIYDKNVCGFFGIIAPTYGSKEFRIQGFLDNMIIIQKKYARWIKLKSIQKLIARARFLHEPLNHCSETRVLDFIVWNCGRSKVRGLME